MATRSSPKYFPSQKDARKQFINAWPLLVIFAVTALIATGFKDPMVRTLLLYSTLVFPAVLVLSLLTAIPQMNYTQLDSKGIHVTILGFIHKTINWSDIESIDKGHIGSIEGLGIAYKPTFNRYVFGRKSRRRYFGWDEMVGPGYTREGSSLLADVPRYFKDYGQK